MSPAPAPGRQQHFRWYRLSLELLAIALAPAIASLMQRLAAPGVILVTLTVIVLVLLVRLLPGSDASTWPRLLPGSDASTWPRLLPYGRTGRRDEVDRLSWQLSNDRDGAAVATGRLLEAIELLGASSPPRERAELGALAARLTGREDRAALASVVADVESHLDRLDAERATLTAPRPRP
ncbi:hypothetical protein [Salana multivorans]